MTAFETASLTRNVQPAQEPITISGLRSHLRIEGNYDDSELHRVSAAARDQVERWTGIALITQGWLLKLDNWWGTAGLELTKPPIVGVDKIEYLPADGGALTLLPDTQYVVEAERRLISWAPGVTPPDLADGRRQRIHIHYTCGIGDTPEAVRDVLPSVEFACYSIATWFYENRGDTDMEVPPAFKHLAFSLMEDLV